MCWPSVAGQSRWRWHVWKVFAGLVLGVGFVAGVAHAQSPDPKLAAEGKKLFEKSCLVCHMAEGKGNKLIPLDGVSAKLKAAEIRQWITSPVEMTAKLPTKPVMPMMKLDLKPAEVDGLVAYLLSLKAPATK